MLHLETSNNLGVAVRLVCTLVLQTLTGKNNLLRNCNILCCNVMKYTDKIDNMKYKLIGFTD